MQVFDEFIDGIHNKLSSDYSLALCFSRCFPYTDGQPISQYKPLPETNK